MAVHRIFYVTQQEMLVYLQRRGEIEQSRCFEHSEDGLSAFSSYLGNSSPQASMMLIDVIEEEFFADSIPRLGMRDRNALIERRVLRKFSRTPYRLGHYQGGKQRREDSHDTMYSAVTNPELVDSWLQILMTHKTPMSGIHSVPLLGAELLAKLFMPSSNALFMTLHQGNMLRQIFVQDGYAKSARLSKSPDVSDPAFGEFIFAEVVRSRRYLERNRLLSAIEDLDIHLVADQETADLILASDQGAMPLKIHFVDPAKAARSVGLRVAPERNQLELLYLAMLSRGKRHASYALSSDLRYFHLQKIRHAIIGVSLAASMACCAVAGANLVDGLFLRTAAAATDKQIQQITETLQRENENLAPVRADSHEMKLAVDTGDYILQNRLPVSWVMQEIGAVLGGFPQVQIDELNWLALPPNDIQADRARLRPGERPMPVIIPALTAIRVELSAQILPFSGDMRDAFAMIDFLVASLQENTAFDQVKPVAYPVDASPQSAISGEVIRGGTDRRAHFRLRLDLSTMTEGSVDEIG